MAGSDLEQAMFISKAITKELVVQSLPLLMMSIHRPSCPSIPPSIPLTMPPSLHPSTPYPILGMGITTVKRTSPLVP